MREIPLSSLNRVVASLEHLATHLTAGLLPAAAAADVTDHIGRLFTSHDDLDAAFVGAEDTRATLADRFDLDDAGTAELKRLEGEYATRVAAEPEPGSARAHRALLAPQPSFDALAECAVTASDARALIERGCADRFPRRPAQRLGAAAGLVRPRDRPRRGGSLCGWCGRCLGCTPTCGGCTPRRRPRPAGPARCSSPAPAPTLATGRRCSRS
jgi:hypothetical protein